MIDKIKNKVKDNPLCELSINELIELSKIDYNELVDIFGKNYVAQSPDEITVETICYVGDLCIYKKLETYNLRYIFGNFKYYLDKIYYLEELQFVSGKIELAYSNNLSELFEILDNVEYMKYVLKQDGYLLKYVPEELKNDKEVVLEAVKRNGRVLDYASVELKNNKYVVLKAVKRDGYAIKYASERLKKDKFFILCAGMQMEYSDALFYIPNIVRKSKKR